MADGDHFSAAGDWELKRKRPGVRIGKPIRTPQFRSNADVKKIKELEAEVARLTKLVHEHQTYQTKQGDKT
jgi:hypothetical protein